MLPEEKLIKSKELLEINRKKLEAAQIKFSQLNPSYQVLDVVKESKLTTIQKKIIKDEPKTTEKKHHQISQSVPILIETYDRNLSEIYDQLFWGYEINDIQEQTYKEDTIKISGWVLGKKCSIVAVEVVFLHSIIKKVSVDRSYPDIVKRYPQASQLTEIGFNIEFILKDLPPKFNWLIQAVFIDETRMPIGCIGRNNNKSLNIHKTPLLTKEAIQFLENFFQQKTDARVLEFGSGGSTIWLSKLTKNLTSIEHDAKWFQQIKNYIEKQKNCHPVDIKLLPRPYHTICEKLPEASFDLIIVDGRDRMKCFEASIKLLKPGGILMLDDAQRGRYKQCHNLSKDWQFTKTVTQARHTYWWEKPFEQNKFIGRSQSIPNQKPVSEEFEESAVIAGVAMVKDEEDIIYYTLAGNYREGIKKFVVLDHLSSDGTRDEIRRFADDHPEAMVYLIEDRDPLFHKSRKNSAAAEFANKIWGAEWIFPFDADEIISASDKPLPKILSQLDQKHICLGLQHRNHLLRAFYDQSEANPLKRMTHRKKEDRSIFPQGYSKIMVRWHSGMRIGQGQHKVNFQGKQLPVTVLGKNHGLILRQYRYRSREQIKQKIVNGGKAYEVTPNMSQKCGGFWQKQYNQYKKKGEKFIDEFYESELRGDSDAIYDPVWV
ncbi:MAG: hypothetical protein F6K54_06220 [Okeania sp. SIO3B5]|uniref:glycosyltransferase family 2 protein n=1 Tax=Okeania sp. SIO3B5 TaxID=2607811 RepID=UPI00140074B8|nr:glycosyltransferase family 2 protein [Okeania sp. SIO3B5]NEO52708.1 hypothetical protein [Okeania sp. SIO3B5]